MMDDMMIFLMILHVCLCICVLVFVFCLCVSRALLCMIVCRYEGVVVCCDSIGDVHPLIVVVRMYI